MPSGQDREIAIEAPRGEGRLFGLILACLIPPPERASASEGPPGARSFELT